VEKEEGGWAVGLKGRGRKSLRRFFFSKIFFLNLVNFSKLLTLSKSSKHFFKKTLKLLKFTKHS
jgi:hypothetical protein